MGTVLDILPQIPAADPQDGDGDGSSSDSQLGVEAQTQPQPEPTSQLFTAGRLLVFSPLKVRLNPSAGWTFAGKLPPFHARASLDPPDRKIYVGITDGQP